MRTMVYTIGALLLSAPSLICSTSVEQNLTALAQSLQKLYERAPQQTPQTPPARPTLPFDPSALLKGKQALKKPSSPTQPAQPTTQKPPPQAAVVAQPAKPAGNPLAAAAAAAAEAARNKKLTTGTTQLKKDYPLVKAMLENGTSLFGMPSSTKNGIKDLQTVANTYFAKIGNAYNKNFVELANLNSDVLRGVLKKFPAAKEKYQKEFIIKYGIPFILIINPLLIKEALPVYQQLDGIPLNLIKATYQHIIDEVQFYLDNNFLPADECTNLCNALNFPAMLKLHNLVSAADSATIEDMTARQLLPLIDTVNTNEQKKVFKQELENCIGKVADYISTLQPRTIFCTLTGPYKPFVIELAELKENTEALEQNKSGKCANAQKIGNLQKVITDIENFAKSCTGSSCKTCQQWDLKGELPTHYNKGYNIDKYTSAQKEFMLNIQYLEKFMRAQKSIAQSQNDSALLAKLTVILEQHLPELKRLGK